MDSIVFTSIKNAAVRGMLVRPCLHSRLVDEARNADGNKTGQLVCLECRAELPGPALGKPRRFER